MKPMNHWITWADHVLRGVLGVLFISAGVIKLHDPEAFTVVIEAFGLVPDVTVGPISVFLPLAEIGIGLGVIFNRPLFLHAMSLLLVFFLILLGYGMSLGLDIDCGCYGPEDPESRAFGGLQTAFYRDLVMAAGIILLYTRRIHTFYYYKHHGTEELL